MIFTTDHIPGDLRAVRIYVLADYRKKCLCRFIDKQRSFCAEKGYDFEWIGYDGDDFHPSKYDEFNDRIGLYTLNENTLTVLFAEVSSDGVESDKMHYMTAGYDFSVKLVFKYAHSVEKSSVKNPKRRFILLRALEIMDFITDMLPVIRCFKV